MAFKTDYRNRAYIIVGTTITILTTVGLIATVGGTVDPDRTMTALLVLPLWPLTFISGFLNLSVAQKAHVESGRALWGRIVLGIVGIAVAGWLYLGVYRSMFDFSVDDVTMLLTGAGLGFVLVFWIGPVIVRRSGSPRSS